MTRGDRLTVARLAKLLEIAERNGLLPTAIFLSKSSPRGFVLLSQLLQVRKKSKARQSWAELARIMAQVDQLAEQLDRWTHPRFMLDPPFVPTEWLHLAAKIRSEEHGGRGRRRMELLEARLSRVLEADQRAEERLRSKRRK